MIRRTLNTLLVCAALSLTTSLGIAAQIKPEKVAPDAKCPVCGMFVAKYPDFAAQIRFRDGRSFYFDGAKDMFKFYLQLPRYAPGRRAAEVTAVFVNNYYDLKPIDGRTAVYVSGSDVYGPMGRELIPFAGAAEAKDFLKDHHGKRLYRFPEVTPAVLNELDR